MNEKKAYSILRKNVLAVLELKRWSQCDLAREMGLPQSQVNKWITGYQSPSLENVLKIAKGLDIPMHHLLNPDLKVELILHRNIRILP